MIRIIASVCLLFPATLLAQDLGQLTNEEKTEISAHLKSSMESLESLVAGLTQEQWNYKQVDSVWSIAEIAEHLEKSEKGLFSMVTDQLTASPGEDRAEEERIKTSVVMDAITSRDNKVKTRPELEPQGLYKTPDDFLKSFRKLRYESLVYAQSTEDELRHHFVPFGPLGELDGYQILMFMSGHLERHLQQIEEVMDDPSYPSM